jgi:hypothetical protein
MSRFLNTLDRLNLGFNYLLDFLQSSLWDIFHRSLEKNNPKFKNVPDPYFRVGGPLFWDPLIDFIEGSRFLKFCFLNQGLFWAENGVRTVFFTPQGPLNPQGPILGDQGP